MYIQLPCTVVKGRHHALFDWDEGNREKCQKHGMTIVEVESVFQRNPVIGPDLTHSSDEERQRAVGQTASDRTAFIVFTARLIRGVQHIRPISARYMHLKERQAYDRFRER